MRKWAAILFVAATVLGGVGAFALNTGIGWVISPEQAAPGVALAPRVERPEAHKVVRRSSSPAWVREILCRNLFDIEAVDLTKCGPATAPSGEVQAKFDSRKAQLKGTQVAEPAVYSSAMILEDGKPFAWSYGIGDSIAGAKIIRIEAKQVVLDVNGQEQILSMDDQSNVKRSTSSKPAASDEEGISRNGNTVSVSKKLFSDTINDMDAVSKLARPTLHRNADGEPDGFRLSSIRRGTLVDKLGIKNGDVIHSVNGKPLDSTAAAMEAFNTMQSEGRFCFDVTRRGSQKEMCYELN